MRSLYATVNFAVALLQTYWGDSVQSEFLFLVFQRDGSHLDHISLLFDLLNLGERPCKGIG